MVMYFSGLVILLVSAIALYTGLIAGSGGVVLAAMLGMFGGAGVVVRGGINLSLRERARDHEYLMQNYR